MTGFEGVGSGRRRGRLVGLSYNSAQRRNRQGPLNSQLSTFVIPKSLALHTLHTLRTLYSLQPFLRPPITPIPPIIPISPIPHSAKWIRVDRLLVSSAFPRIEGRRGRFVVYCHVKMLASVDRGRTCPTNTHAPKSPPLWVTQYSDAPANSVSAFCFCDALPVLNSGRTPLAPIRR